MSLPESTPPSHGGAPIDREADAGDRWAIWAEHSGDLVLVVGQPSYDVEFINRAGRQSLQLAEPVFQPGRSLMEFVSSACLWTLLNEAVPSALRTGSWTGPLIFRRMSGDEFPASATLSVQRRSAAGVDALVLVARDTSEAETALGVLKRDQRYLRALLENVPDIIYFKDLESRFLRVNHAFALRFGLNSPEKLVGHSDFDYFTPEHAQPAYDAEQQIIRTGRPLLNLEEKETWPDGRVTWAATTKLPFYNEYGKVVGTFGITRDITARKHAELALAESQRRLIDASRLAGMAEVASGVLHNVGNAFNSVNTSATLIADQLRQSRMANLEKVSALLDENAKDLARFFAEDPRGKQLPLYLAQLAKQLLKEREVLLQEIESLRKGVEHIKGVIAMQQSYAHASSMVEDVPLAELVNEALVMNGSVLLNSGVSVARDFAEVPPVFVARHRVLEILVNLIRNAEQAMKDADTTRRELTFTLTGEPDGRVKLVVRDTGPGISKENLQRIFSFGFTTKKTGHGFGLHNSALAAKEMGGVLYAQSEGEGRGAEFVLILPTRGVSALALPPR
jgi:two-component system, NtrC family, sensor kinase